MFTKTLLSRLLVFAAVCNLSIPSAQGSVELSHETSTSGHHYTYYLRGDSLADFSVLRPNKTDKQSVFCIPAAFTTKAQGIDGIAISDGKNVGEPSGPQLGGAIVFMHGDFEIFPSVHGRALTKDFLADLQKAGGSLFQQFQLVKDGFAESFRDTTVCQRRAMVVFRNGGKGVVESKGSLTLTQFAHDLEDMQVLNAIYTDMGQWDEGWYRDAQAVTTIGLVRSKTAQQTNWVVFRQAPSIVPHDFNDAGMWLQKHLSVVHEPTATDAQEWNRAILYGKFPLPRMQSGYDLVPLWRGKYKGTEGDPTVLMVTSGIIDGQPGAVSYVAWGTGGTGVFEVLTLYRKVAGKIQAVGQHDLEDRASVNSLKISQNSLVLDWTKHAPSDSAPEPSMHEVRKLHAKDFEPLKQDAP